MYYWVFATFLVAATSALVSASDGLRQSQLTHQHTHQNEQNHQHTKNQHPYGVKRGNQLLTKKVKAKIPLTPEMIEEIEKRKKGMQFGRHGEENVAKMDHLRGGNEDNQLNKSHVLKVLIYCIH